MERVLVTLTSDERDPELLDAAERYVTGLDAEIVLYCIRDQDEFEANIQRKARSGQTSETIADIEDAAEETAREIGEAAFDDDVAVIAVGELGSIPDDILRTAKERDVNHVFVSGRRRSPTSKLITGDIAQKVILNFDGPVTITTRSE